MPQNENCHHPVAFIYKVKNYKKIDVLLTGYCGAGPYPQCFENLNTEEKKQEGFKKEKFFLDQSLLILGK